MERDEIWRVALDLDAALWAGLIRSDTMPSVATELLVGGADSPVLRDLAGLDVQPFDPREAGELLQALLGELEAEEPSVGERLARAVDLLAAALLQEVLTIEEGLKHAAQLFLAAGYPDDRELASLELLRDEWGAGWGRGDDEMAGSVVEVAARIAGRGGDPSPLVIGWVGRSR